MICGLWVVLEVGYFGRQPRPDNRGSAGAGLAFRGVGGLSGGGSGSLRLRYRSRFQSVMRWGWYYHYALWVFLGVFDRPLFLRRHHWFFLFLFCSVPCFCHDGSPCKTCATYTTRDPYSMLRTVSGSAVLPHGVTRILKILGVSREPSHGLILAFLSKGGGNSGRKK